MSERYIRADGEPVRHASKQKCEGEAHSNVYIDNCMLCSPNWGEYYACPACLHKLSKKGECRIEDCLSYGERFKTT